MFSFLLALACMVIEGHGRSLQAAPEDLQALSSLLLSEAALGAWSASRNRQQIVSRSSPLNARGGEKGSEFPKVLFVLGGPGAGKGTQCDKILEECSSWTHISAGDCLREERADPTSKDGEMINAFITEGKLVPSSVVVKLIRKKLEAKAKEGKTCALIDGFPRNEENREVWRAEFGDSIEERGVLFFDVSEEEMEKRLIKRGETSGRADDNVETIRKRFATYRDETMPVIECYRNNGKLFCIDAGRDVEEVWDSTKAVIKEIELS